MGSLFLLYMCLVATSFQLKQSNLEGGSLRLRKKATYKAQQGPKAFQVQQGPKAFQAHKAPSLPKFTLARNTTGEEAHQSVQLPAHCTKRSRIEPSASHMLDKHSATKLHPQPSFYFLSLKQGLTKLASLAWPGTPSPASTS